jgi:uncharacterized NAD(P)/FAD-binding protein YdhS
MAGRVVAIVGGGFSGCLLALNLLRSRAEGLHVYLIEKDQAFGRGVAFSTHRPDHLLNVRAGNMSAYLDRPTHFQDWLAVQTGQPADPFSFAPRWVYGDYLQAQLRAAAQSAEAAGRLTLVGDEVTEVVRAGGRLVVRLALGRAMQADVVVLATGHGAPMEVVPRGARFANDPRYVANPWADGVLGRIKPDDRVLLLGSGLTAVDVIASLDSAGHHGEVVALSRHGLTPRRHARTAGATIAWTPRPGEPLSRALQRYRRQADRFTDWRRAFDGVRDQVQAIWITLSEAERRRALRHLRPWWDAHRHRMAPQVAARIDAHLAQGRLRVVAGRMLSLRAEIGGVTVTWRPRAHTSIRADRTEWVVNCTGPEGDPRRSDNSVVRRLIESGLARPDPLNLGLDVDGDGRLIGSGGAPAADLFGLGPLTRGALWEVTAVPDIRIQAQRLAARIVADVIHAPVSAIAS